MTRRTSLTLFQLLLFLLAIAAPRPAAADDLDGFVFGDWYGKFRAEGEKWLNTQHEAILFSDKTWASTCRGYMERMKVTEVLSSKDIGGIQCKFELCYLYEDIEKAKPHKGYRPESYASELYNRFDLNSYYSGMKAEKEDGRGKPTMADQEDDLIKVVDSRTIVRHEPNVWYSSLKLLSDADINGNGKPDWQLMAREEAVEGTMLYCDSLVAYDVEPTGIIKAKLYRLMAKER